MDQDLLERCNLLVNNKKRIKDAFKWENDLMVLACAAMLTGRNAEADTDKMKICEKIIKEYEGIFSEFRSEVKLAMVGAMSLSDEPEAYFKNVKTVYELLTKKKLTGSEYRILAAMTIVEGDGMGKAEELVKKTETIYKKMKENHKWLTSEEDFPFAAMLAVSEYDVDALVAEMEEDYAILKRMFRDRNAVQNLSHVLALDKTPADVKCEKVCRIFDILQEKKHKFGNSYEVITLGSLNMLEVDAERIASLIIEADDCLKGFKGFGNISLGAANRRMYAAQLVADTLKKDNKIPRDTTLPGTLSYIISVQICMMVIMISVMTSTTVTSS